MAEAGAAPAPVPAPAVVASGSIVIVYHMTAAGPAMLMGEETKFVSDVPEQVAKYETDFGEAMRDAFVYPGDITNPADLAAANAHFSAKAAAMEAVSTIGHITYADVKNSSRAGYITAKARFVEATRRGHWGFTKGASHPGESLPNTAVREVEEETGVVLDVRRIVDTGKLLATSRKAEKHYQLFIYRLIDDEYRDITDRHVLDIKNASRHNELHNIHFITNTRAFANTISKEAYHAIVGKMVGGGTGAKQPPHAKAGLEIIGVPKAITVKATSPKAKVRAASPKAKVKAASAKAKVKAASAKAKVKAASPKAKVKAASPKAKVKAASPKAKVKAASPKAKVKVTLKANHKTKASPKARAKATRRSPKITIQADAIYTEEQKSRFCGQHSLNHILQEQKFISLSGEADKYKQMDGKIDLMAFCRHIRSTSKKTLGAAANHTIVCPTDGNYQADILVRVINDELKYTVTELPFREAGVAALRQKLPKMRSRLLGLLVNLGGYHWTAVVSRLRPSQHLYIDSLDIPKEFEFMSDATMITNLSKLNPYRIYMISIPEAGPYYRCRQC